MRQQELIHLHNLLIQIRRHIEAAEDVPADAFDAYDAHAVSPIAVHRRKDDHQDAVFLLLDGLHTAAADHYLPNQESSEQEEIKYHIYLS